MSSLSSNAPSRNHVNIDSLEEKWLLATLATANDPQWFENKSVKQCFTSRGEKLLSKFIEKFKEVKSADKQKDPSLIILKKKEGRNEKREDVEMKELNANSHIDIEENKRFVKWLLEQIEKGNKEIFDDKFLETKIKENGGIVHDKYMKNKSELFSSGEKKEEEYGQTSSEEERC